MKKLITITTVLLITFVGFTFTSCEKEIAEGTPECIINKISDFEENYACKDGQVEKYTFQGEVVYVFDHGIKCGADLTSEVVDEECNTLGYLGGIAGNQIINGEDFYENAVHIGNVWEN
ncbi:MAG: hypothetical protein C0596_04165 [Marinilabiliales bacterium]|nr:MAG: hypothetical protein C0596_04165 [Marinilabiliales bacterium]